MIHGEYNLVVRRCQGQRDCSLFRSVKPTPIHNEWAFVEYAPSGLRSFKCVEEELRGGGTVTRLANVCFRSKDACKSDTTFRESGQPYEITVSSRVKTKHKL